MNNNMEVQDWRKLMSFMWKVIMMAIAIRLIFVISGDEFDKMDLLWYIIFFFLALCTVLGLRDNDY